ncbi:MAG: hypothetical protein CMN76_00600 [Spirochaetaceae bacterium]|nr:hypothetical protein [Spirochaetaceae bacterium]
MPLGHPGEMPIAALELAAHCSFILCESKRGAQSHFKRAGLELPDERFLVFDKKTDSVQYQQFLDELINLSLKQPVHLLLVSDAGMPIIEDPGAKWVELAEENGFQIHVIGGATAITSAIARAGLNGPFTFGGFPPRDKKARASFFAAIAGYKHTFGFYEAPHRGPDVPAELQAALPARSRVFVAVDMGGESEAFHRLKASELKRLRLPKKPVVFLVY